MIGSRVSYALYRNYTNTKYCAVPEAISTNPINIAAWQIQFHARTRTICVCSHAHAHNFILTRPIRFMTCSSLHRTGPHPNSRHRCWSVIIYTHAVIPLYSLTPRLALAQMHNTTRRHTLIELPVHAQYVIIANAHPRHGFVAQLFHLRGRVEKDKQIKCHIRAGKTCCEHINGKWQTPTQGCSEWRSLLEKGGVHISTADVLDGTRWSAGVSGRKGGRLKNSHTSSDITTEQKTHSSNGLG